MDNSRPANLTMIQSKLHKQLKITKPESYEYDIIIIGQCKNVQWHFENKHVFANQNNYVMIKS